MIDISKIPVDGLNQFFGSSREVVNIAVKKLNKLLSETKQVNNIRCIGEIGEIVGISLVIACHGKMMANVRDVKVDERGITLLKDKKINLLGSITNTISEKEENVPLFLNEIEYTHGDERLLLDFESIDTSNMNILFSTTTTCATIPVMRDREYVFIKQKFINEIMDNPLSQHSCPTNNIISERMKYGPVNVLDDSTFSGKTSGICLLHTTGSRPSKMAQKKYTSKEPDVYTNEGKISQYDSGKITMIITKCLGRGRCQVKKYVLLGPDINHDLLYTDFPEADVYDYLSTIENGISKNRENVWKTDLLRLLDLINSITKVYSRPSMPIYIYDLSCNVFENSSYGTGGRQIYEREKSAIKIIDEIMRKNTAYGSKPSKLKKTKKRSRKYRHRKS